MLRRSYSLNLSSNTQKIELDDFYVASDLSFISGTTRSDLVLSKDENLWIKSPYFPKDLPVEITNSETVKRNGYVIVPKQYPILKAKAYKVTGETGNDGKFNYDLTDLYYIEINGNTYYSKANGLNLSFLVDGEEYSATMADKLIEVNERIYIENDMLVVNGIDFNALINKEKELILTDFTGLYYEYPETWDVTNISYEPTYVQKISIGNNYKKPIECSKVSYGGYRPYITYDNKRYYLEYLREYEEVDGSYRVVGVGVIIDDEAYNCNSLIGFNDYYNNTQFLRESGSSKNMYDRNNYIIEANGKPVIEVKGSKYSIDFMPDSDMDGTGIICIETVTDNLPILLDDRITIRVNNLTSRLIVNTDDSGERYIYFCGRRYDVINNLCNEVVINGINVPITYNDVDNYATAYIENGLMMYFKIDGGKARKVIPVNGNFVYARSMIKSNGKTIYSGVTYEVVPYSGVVINGQKYKVQHYENSYSLAVNEDDIVDKSGITESYDYVEVESDALYRLKVIDTIGNNKFLCIPDLNPMYFDDKSLYQLTSEILYSINYGNFIVEKNTNAFGVLDLYYDTWAPMAVNKDEPVDIYTLADVKRNISVAKKSSFFSIPVGLYENVTNRLEYNDLITNQYYDEETEKAINKLVDMEKDMYSPRYAYNNTLTAVDSLVFNLHFRTRDLDTWKIIDDEGVEKTIDDEGVESDVPLSANYKYSNYFITDYYPYNCYAYSKEKLITNSDLLGFMYFTTDDVKGKRDKLKKSFLRLTLFDSKNPEKQNMLGTSTIYFDIDRFDDVLSIDGKLNGLHYELAVKSSQPDRVNGTSGEDNIDANIDISPTVLTECFKIEEDGTVKLEDLMIGASDLKLDSRLVVKDRNVSPNNSSEGFDAYILKAFANKSEKQTIYMKAEFFHAGVGIKIPMTIPSQKYVNDETEGYSYKAICDWNDNVYNEFISGYDIGSVFERLYVPIDISYDRTERKFIYSISEEGDYRNAIQMDDNGNKNLVFNLFELKIKPQ